MRIPDKSTQVQQQSICTTFVQLKRFYPSDNKTTSDSEKHDTEQRKNPWPRRKINTSASRQLSRFQLNIDSAASCAAAAAAARHGNGGGLGERRANGSCLCKKNLIKSLRVGVCQVERTTPTAVTTQNRA